MARPRPAPTEATPPSCACLTLCIDHDWNGAFLGSLYYTKPGGPIQDSRRVERHDTRCPVAERARIRRELEAWLIGNIDPKDAGLFNSRRIVDEINRICPEEG